MGDAPDSSARPEQRLERERVRRAARAGLFGSTLEPTRLGRFEVRKRLGEGALGVVYAGYDPKLGRDVALKVLRRGAGDVPLLAEARALARLAHPNVLAVFEVDVADDIPFIVSELVPGGTLRAWVGQPERTHEQVLGALREVGQGILAAHRRGLVHRDIKPENVLVGADGRPRVADFGLARSPSPGAVGAAGTPAYMAPEQRRGDRVDPLSDQFAFAVMAHEALFGALPQGSTQVPVGHPAAALAPVLARGMAEVAEARYPSMAELLEAIDRVRPARARSWRVAAIASGAVVALAAVGAAASPWIAGRGGVAPSAGASRAPGSSGAAIAGSLPEGEDGVLYRRALLASEQGRYEECATLLAARPEVEVLARFRLACAQQIRGEALGAACAAWRQAWGPSPDACADGLMRAREALAAGRYEECVGIIEAAPYTPLATVVLAECVRKLGKPEGYLRSCRYMQAKVPGQEGTVCVDVREVGPRP